MPLAKPRLLAFSLALAICAMAAGCHPRTASAPARPPRGEEAELAVYLRPVPPSTLVLEIASVAIARREGPPVPLDVKLGEISIGTASRERLFAAGRIPTGRYTGLLVGIRKARLPAGDLAVPDAVVTVPIDIQAGAGRGLVVAVALSEGAAASRAVLDASPFAAERPQIPPAPILALASTDELDAVAVLDRRAHRVVGLLPTAPGPREIALDDARQVAYVASARGNRIQAFDLGTLDELVSTRLRLGDVPSSLGLVPDGTQLVVANSGAEAVSLVDPLGGQERQRIELRGEPVQVVLDRPGLRAFVVLRRAAAVSMINLGSDPALGTIPGTGAGIRTIPVEEQPVRALVSAKGDRLTVAYAHAPYLTVYALPGGTPVGRIFAGPGVTTLMQDPATGVLYVSSSDARVQLFDPSTLLPIDAIPLPAPATRLALDAAEAAVLALMPARGSIAVIDLRSRRVRAEIEVGPGTREFALVGAVR